MVLGESMTALIIDYYKPSEFNCKCNYGCGLGMQNMSFNLLLFLCKAREILGQPMIITSAIRCPRHNKDVGGAEDSTHMKGWAVDVSCPDSVFKRDLTYLALEDHYSVGVPSSSFLHLDCRDTGSIVFGY